MRDPVVQVRQQFDRARSPIDQAAAPSDARPQALSKSRDDDRRHRTHASDQKGPVQTREASRSRQNRSRDLESRSCYMIRGDFQASAWLDLQRLHQSPDNHWLAIGNEDQSASLWNLDDEQNLETEDASGIPVVLNAPYGVGGVSFSPDG